MKFLQFVKKEMPFFLIAAMAAGVIKGHYAPMEFSTIICISALLVMIFPVMINLKVEEGVHHLKGIGKPLLVTALINFVFSPLLAVILAKIFFASNPYIAIGFFLISLIPTSGMTVNWTHTMQANMHSAIVLVTFNVLGAFIVVPFVLPFLITNVLGVEGVAIEPMLILEKLAFVVLLPMTMGFITRLIFKAVKKEQKLKELQPVFSGVANLGLLYVMFLIMSLATTQILVQHYKESLVVIAPMFIYYIVMLIVIMITVKKLFKRNIALPVLFTTFLRYHVISLGIALAAFSDNMEQGVWVILPLIVAFLVQPIFTAFLARGYLKNFNWKSE